MSVLDYTYKLKENVLVWVNWDIFEHSFRNETKTLDMLDLVDIALTKVHKVIWINWSQWTWNIKTIDSSEILEQAKLLPWGIDWLIIRNLENFNKNISIILWVADCWAISFSDKTWDTIWLIHAWYSWVWDNIIGNIFKQLEDVKDFSEYSFYIWPMMGKNFELEKKFYFKIFHKLFDKWNSYWLNPDDYFEETSEQKGNLNLRKMILDIFIKHWIKKEQVVFSEIETNSPDNPWPSYRLNRTDKRIWIFLDRIYNA